MARVDMVMPQMGESITEGTIIKWLKKEGDMVEKDEIILEISTDKVDSEIPSPHSGKVSKILIPEGQTVKVGAVIAHIESAVVAKTEKPVASAPETKTTGAKSDKPEPAKPETLKGEPAPGSMIDVVMPQMGESINEGTVIKWLKKEGERVEKDELLLEISTDKVDSEIPSPQSGVISKLLAKEGDTVKVGAVIAKLESTRIQTVVTPAQTSAATPAARQKAMQPRQGQPVSQKVSSEMVEEKAITNGKRRFYSPLVRSIAKAESVSVNELNQIAGSGAHGRVTKTDILNYIGSRGQQGFAPSGIVSRSVQKPATLARQVDYSDVEIIPMDNMRKSIAAHMVNSIQTSPHVFMITETDMTNIVVFREKNKDAFLQKTGTKLTYMPFITQASARALQDYPLVNSSVDGTNIIRKKYINIGLAVALENSGLIVPVIKNADNLNIVGLARAINDLAERARSKKLKPDEVQGGTFSITNMGTFGSLAGFPIINQPQVAILGVGAIQKRPVVINDAIAIRSMMYISLSFDHRIVDGALAGQFLERVAHYLTNFDTNNIY